MPPSMPGPVTDSFFSCECERWGPEKWNDPEKNYPVPKVSFKHTFGFIPFLIPE